LKRALPSLLLECPRQTQDLNLKRPLNLTRQQPPLTCGLQGSSVLRGNVTGFACKLFLLASVSDVFRYHEDGAFYPAEILRGAGSGRWWLLASFNFDDHCTNASSRLLTDLCALGGSCLSQNTKSRSRTLRPQTCARREPRENFTVELRFSIFRLAWFNRIKRQ